MSSLYILDVTPLTHSVGCLFIFLHCANAFGFYIARFIFPSVVLAKEDRSKKKNIAKADFKDFTVCFLLGASWFQVLYLSL